MIKVIACKIYEYYILQLDQSWDNYEFIYLDIQQHNYPHQLARAIQKEIDKSEDYEKIIILYGLCGNALLEIAAGKTALYLVCVHDCLSVLLGSKERFEQLFYQRRSSSWSCYSLKLHNCNQYNDQSYRQWCQQYDQETANYLQQSLMKEPAIYLTYNDQDDLPYLDKQELIRIDLSFLERILSLKDKDIIVLKESQRLSISSDFDEVMKIQEESSND